MMKFRCMILLLFIICAGCRKENEPPIIEPGSYFPVYPNSWWKYLVNDSIIYIDTTSDDYIVHSFKIDGKPDKYSEPARVPFLNSEPIYGYCFVEDVYMPETPYDGIYKLWPILSETVGDIFWGYFVDHRMDRLCELVTVKSKSFNGTDSVLFLVSGESSISRYPDYIFPEVRYRYFVKGVGCISDIVVDTVTSDTVSKKILIDYYVNHQ